MKRVKPHDLQRVVRGTWCVVRGAWCMSQRQAVARKREAPRTTNKRVKRHTRKRKNHGISLRFGRIAFVILERHAVTRTSKGQRTNHTPARAVARSSTLVLFNGARTDKRVYCLFSLSFTLLLLLPSSSSCLLRSSIATNLANQRCVVVTLRRQ
jgi:hypothetical protein